MAAVRQLARLAAVAPAGITGRRAALLVPPSPALTLLLGEEEAAVQEGRLGVVHQQQHAHVRVVVKVGVHLASAHHACGAGQRRVQLAERRRRLQGLAGCMVQHPLVEACGHNCESTHGLSACLPFPSNDPPSDSIGNADWPLLPCAPSPPRHASSASPAQAQPCAAARWPACRPPCAPSRPPRVPTRRHQPVLLPRIHVLLQLAGPFALRQRHHCAIPALQPLLQPDGTGAQRRGRMRPGCAPLTKRAGRPRGAWGSSARSSVGLTAARALPGRLPAKALPTAATLGLGARLQPRTCIISSRFFSRGSPSSPRKGLCVSSTVPGPSSCTGPTKGRLGRALATAATYLVGPALAQLRRCLCEPRVLP